MTDRELLERAAKAAGIDGAVLAPDNDGSAGIWNPLEDDGDALRLAIRLQMHVLEGVAQLPNGDMHFDGGKEPMAATRRAIVEAAATMARSA